MNKIPGGYYLSARQKFNSPIFRQPPYMREIWDYLCGQANHKTIVRHGNKIERGQVFTSFKEICDDLAWFVGYRKEKYKKWQCEKTMKWLTRVNMIATTRATRGILITIINYDFYQNPKNYESNDEGNKRATREQQTTDTINKNDKNVKNDKKDNSLPDFEIFWAKYNYKIGKPDCIDYWTGRKRLKNGKQMNNEMRDKCLSVVDKYVKNTHKDDTYPSRKHPKTYLYNSCWEDEIVQTKENKINIGAMIRKSDFGRGETDPILREAVKRCGGFRSLGLMRDIPYKQACDQIEKEYKRLKGD